MHKFIRGFFRGHLLALVSILMACQSVPKNPHARSDADSASSEGQGPGAAPNSASNENADALLPHVANQSNRLGQGINDLLTPDKNSCIEPPLDSHSGIYRSQVYARPDGVKFKVEWVLGRDKIACKNSESGKSGWIGVQASEYAGGESQVSFYTEGAAAVRGARVIESVRARNEKYVQDPNRCVCALPYRFWNTKDRVQEGGKLISVKRPPVVRVRFKGDTGSGIVCPVGDVGPHHGGETPSDPYWLNPEGNGCRPRREAPGRANIAGIDMTPNCFDQLEGRGGEKKHNPFSSETINGETGGHRLRQVEWQFL